MVGERAGGRLSKSRSAPSVGPLPHCRRGPVGFAAPDTPPSPGRLLGQKAAETPKGGADGRLGSRPRAAGSCAEGCCEDLTKLSCLASVPFPRSPTLARGGGAALSVGPLERRAGRPAGEKPRHLSQISVGDPSLSPHSEPDSLHSPRCLQGFSSPNSQSRHIPNLRTQLLCTKSKKDLQGKQDGEQLKLCPAF